MGWFKSKLTREQRVEGKANVLFGELMNNDNFEFTYQERVEILRQFKTKIEDSFIEETASLANHVAEVYLTQDRLNKALNTLQNG